MSSFRSREETFPRPYIFWEEGGTQLILYTKTNTTMEFQSEVLAEHIQ